jgi:hypothetical protein
MGQFIKQQFSQTGALTKDANRQLRDALTLRPVVQTGESYPYIYLGTAIDYRIRYAFAITPYQRLVAWEGALQLAVQPASSEQDILLDEDEVFKILLITPIFFDITRGVAQGPYPFKLIRQFFEALDAVLKVIQPVGRRLELQAEHLLDRYCFVLSLFEQAARSNTYLQGPLMQPTVKRSVEELLAIPQQSWIDDMGMLFNAFYDRYQHLLSLPHVLNPTFAGSGDVGGADADLVVDGCLIDIKTSIAPQLKADYLYQLAGYLLLDYDDQLHINAVGIYMARQAILFRWAVPEFLHVLTGDSRADLQTLRLQFRALCQSMRARDSF